MSQEPTIGDSDTFSVLHSDRLVLVDPLGQIRGYYESDPAGIDRILEDARLLALLVGRPAT